MRDWSSDVCSSDLLTSLDLSENTELKTLHCENNNALTSLNVSRNMKLETLNCTNNLEIHGLSQYLSNLYELEEIGVVQVFLVIPRSRIVSTFRILVVKSGESCHTGRGVKEGAGDDA